MEPTEPLWRIRVTEDVMGLIEVEAVHFEGEKVLTVKQITDRLGQLEQARYHIAALESAMIEAGLELENPWDVLREDMVRGVGGG